MALGDIAAAFRSAFRKYVTDGVPASGRHSPRKDDIFATGDTIEARMAAVETLAEEGRVPPLAAVRVATTADGTLATAFDNGSTIDGVVLATNDRILIKNQTDQTANGVYVVQASGAPVRATDADTGPELLGCNMVVTAGTANSGTGWINTNEGTITLGVTNITFVQNSANAGFAAVLAAVQADADAAAASAAEAAAAAGAIEDEAPDGYAFVIAGPAGEFPVGLTDAGIWEMAYAEPRVLAGASGRLARELLIPRPTLPAELMLVVSYGQSLSLGHGTGAPISTSAEQYGALRFTAGPRAYAGAGSDDADHATLIPYIEVQETTFGESPLYGCLETMGDRLKYESGGSPIDFGLSLIGEALGENSQAINALKTGTYFDRIGVATTYGRTRAREVNKSFQLGGMIFTEGEADDLAATSNANYISRFGELRTNLLAAITPITGQTEVPIIMNQVASHQQSSLTAPLTALAQLTLGRTGAANKVFLACPTYWADFVDGYHLEPESSHMLGCYYGLALKRVLIDDVDWQFLDIASHQRVVGSGGVENVVIVRFNVPHPPLQFSAALVSQVANEGFTMVAAASETAVTITSVSLFGANAIKIVCSAVIPANARLRYAWIGSSGSGRQTGPRGNVCDSQGDIIKVASIHGARRLDNYLPMLEYVIS